MTFDISTAELLQLLGLREAELFILRRRIAVLERQLAMTDEQLAEPAAGVNGAIHD